MKKRLFITIIILTVVLSNLSTAFSIQTTDILTNSVILKVGNSKAYANNSQTMIDTDNKNVVPIIKNDRTLVPVRFISENYGSRIEWDENTRTAAVYYGNTVALIAADSNDMFVNNENIYLDSPAVIYNGRLFLPLRRLCEDVLKKQVFYDNGLIIINDTAIDKNRDSNAISEISSMFKSKEKLDYMIYYGELNDEIIENAKQYKLVILHPWVGKLTREQVQRIRAGYDINDPNDDVCVLGYISIGEDLRTAGMTPEMMLADSRFTGDGTGPRTDPRPSEQANFDNINSIGNPSSGSTGYASYYLDDNNFDGKPDFNANFKCAFVNAGDPAWFDTLNKMTIDGIDQMPGIMEILSNDYGRGLGCDGLFLDTIDTCAPNSYTDDSSPNKSKFEWTTPGFSSFIERLKSAYPEKLLLQNRGLFFYDSRLPHYKYSPRKNIDFLMFESFMLDSNPTYLTNESFYADNKFNYAPKIMAEAGRPDGFRVLSLGYAEGPLEYQLKDTLSGSSNAGFDILTEDINQTQNIAGFSHYITDGTITFVNNFVLNHKNNEDNIPPVWSSVYNNSTVWPPHEPEPRVGIGQAIPVANGMTVRWDIALDKNNVNYTLYYQDTPFDFNSDPNLEASKNVVLIPQIGDGYINGISPDIYPYQATIYGLEAGKTYYFVIRAKDDSQNQNEEKNTVVKTGVPLK